MSRMINLHMSSSWNIPSMNDLDAEHLEAAKATYIDQMVKEVERGIRHD